MLEDIAANARTRATKLLWDVRYKVRGGWVGGGGGLGPPVRHWDESLSPQGIVACDEMLGYIDAAQRGITVYLEELEGANPILARGELGLLPYRTGGEIVGLRYVQDGTLRI